MIVNKTHLDLINSPVRHIDTKVELYQGSTLVNTFTNNDKVISLTIERVGDSSKFFGFGICQKLNLHLIDKERALNITTDNWIYVYFNDLTVFPQFFVSEVHRDENTNELSITAYDILYEASKHLITEINLTPPYTMEDIATTCSRLFGGGGTDRLVDNDEAFWLPYPNGANLEGSETLREVLDDIAEATQTIYYIDNSENLVFKRLTEYGGSGAEQNPWVTIGKAEYFTLESGDNRRLTTIVNATELGDNLSATTGLTGTTQVIKDNVLIELREDIDTILADAIAVVGNMTINQFDCSWRGNYLLEIGDKIGLVTKDNQTVCSYVLNDVITYNGVYTQHTQWSYTDDAGEAAESNPITLGEAIRQTYAKVDKVNKQVDILASEVASNSESIGSLMINTDAITASVQELERSTQSNLTDINEQLVEVSNKVSATLTADEMKVEIEKELATMDITRVKTTTGFTFNETGLTVSKSGSEMETTITEDGMTVYKDGSAVLTANNIGVDAKNLRATTYLIIGTNSRFEDVGNRTACFWIGG